MSEPPSEEVVAEAEGVRLRLSDRTATGYEGVHWASGKRFEAKAGAVTLGVFSTAVEAATCYARHHQREKQPTPLEEVAAPAAAPLAQLACGLRLHVSSRNRTGYTRVEPIDGRFRASAIDQMGIELPLGTRRKWRRAAPPLAPKRGRHAARTIRASYEPLPSCRPRSTLLFPQAFTTQRCRRRSRQASGLQERHSWPRHSTRAVPAAPCAAIGAAAASSPHRAPAPRALGTLCTSKRETRTSRSL